MSPATYEPCHADEADLELGGDQAEPMGGLLRDLGFDEPDVMLDEDGDLGRSAPSSIRR